jgi:hypothetical protein
VNRAWELLFWLIVASATTTLACSTVQSAAAQDPMKCERDPKCTSHQDKSKDCVTACVDDPACIERCQEVSGQRW